MMLCYLEDGKSVSWTSFGGFSFFCIFGWSRMNTFKSHDGPFLNWFLIKKTMGLFWIDELWGKNCLYRPLIGGCKWENYLISYTIINRNLLHRWYTYVLLDSDLRTFLYDRQQFCLGLTLILSCFHSDFESRPTSSLAIFPPCFSVCKDAFRGDWKFRESTAIGLEISFDESWQLDSWSWLEVGTFSNSLPNAK